MRYNYYSAGLTVSIIDLNCTGSEDTIWNCPNNALLGQYTCSSNYYAAGVACQSKAVIINTLRWLLITGTIYCEFCDWD